MYRVALIWGLLVSTLASADLKPIVEREMNGDTVFSFVTVNEQCVVGDQNLRGVNAIVAAIIPNLVDVVIDSGIEIIKDAGKDSTKHREADVAEFFYKLDSSRNKFTQKSQCITFITGSATADPRGSVLSNVTAPPAAPASETDKIQKHAADKGLKRVDMFYEAYSIPSEDGTQFRLQSAFLYIGKPLHGGSRGFHYLPTLELRQPGETETVIATATFPVIKNVKPYQLVTQNTLTKTKSRSQWIAYPSISETNKAKLKAYKATKSEGKLLYAEACTLGIDPDTVEFKGTNMQKAAQKGKLKMAIKDSKCEVLTDTVIAQATGDLSHYRAAKAAVKSAAGVLSQANADVVAANRAGELDGKTGTTKALIEAQHASADAKILHAKGAAEQQVEGRKVTFANRLQTNEQTQWDIANCLGALVLTQPAPGSPVCAKPGGAEFLEWRVTMTETKPGSKFMKKLAEVLESSKSGIKDAVKEKVDPTKKKELTSQVETERKARVVLENSLRQKKQDVDVKTFQLANAEGELAVLQASHQLVNAKFDANELARQLGIEIPYPEVE